LIQELFLQINWNPNPYVFELGWLKLKWYGLMFALAVLAGYWILVLQFRKRNLPVSRVATLVQYQFLGGIIGARLGQVLFYDLAYYLANPIEILMIWHGGLASHGAAIGGFVSLWLFLRKYKILSYLELLDILVVPAAAIGGLIRIGNLMNSEIIGQPTSMPWAFEFAQRDAIPRHPSPLYEAVLLFSVLALLFFLHQNRKLPLGMLTGLFFTLTFTGRFGLEFFKENTTVSQPLNIVVALFGMTVLGWSLLFRRNKDRVKNPPQPLRGGE
jgi:phosphatidylglycerol:prolipoprotein diacylglycerol transferase